MGRTRTMRWRWIAQYVPCLLVRLFFFCGLLHSKGKEQKKTCSLQPSSTVCVKNSAGKKSRWILFLLLMFTQRIHALKTWIETSQSKAKKTEAKQKIVAKILRICQECANSHQFHLFNASKEKKKMDKKKFQVVHNFCHTVMSIVCIMSHLGTACRSYSRDHVVKVIANDQQL